MARTNGIVVRVMADGKAEVVAEKKGGCGSCSSAHTCHTSKSAMKMKTTVINPVGARPGDMVTLNVSTSSLLKGLVLIYLFPVIGLMAGAIMGSNMAQVMSMSQTGSAILFGGAGLVLGFVSVILISRLMASNDAYKPVIVRIVSKGANEALTIGHTHPVPEDCTGEGT